VAASVRRFVILRATDSDEAVSSLMNVKNIVMANVAGIVTSSAVLELVDHEGEITDERWVRPPKFGDRGCEVTQSARSASVSSLRAKRCVYAVTH
jgi:hypothetical protein